MKLAAEDAAGITRDLDDRRREDGKEKIQRRAARV
jgi:hypothetical protein